MEKQSTDIEESSKPGGQDGPRLAQAWWRWKGEEVLWAELNLSSNPAPHFYWGSGRLEHCQEREGGVWEWHKGLRSGWCRVQYLPWAVC